MSTCNGLYTSGDLWRTQPAKPRWSWSRSSGHRCHRPSKVIKTMRCWWLRIIAVVQSDGEMFFLLLIFLWTMEWIFMITRIDYDDASWWSLCGCRYLEASTSGHDIAVYKVDPSPLEGKMVCVHLYLFDWQILLEDNFLNSRISKWICQ